MSPTIFPHIAKKHNSNHKGFTGSIGDWKIVYFKLYGFKTEAYQAELPIKRKKSKKYIEELICSAGSEHPAYHAGGSGFEPLSSHTIRHIYSNLRILLLPQQLGFYFFNSRIGLLNFFHWYTQRSPHIRLSIATKYFSRGYEYVACMQ